LNAVKDKEAKIIKEVQEVFWYNTYVSKNVCSREAVKNKRFENLWLIEVGNDIWNGLCRFL
jgi:hypothetical protein